MPHSTAQLYRLASICVILLHMAGRPAFFLPQVGWIVAPLSGSGCLCDQLPSTTLSIGGSAMTKATLPRRRARRRHSREEGMIDHLVRVVFPKAEQKGMTHPPTTASGLSVEEQVRKEWHPGLGGLAIF